jgi:hypothetical protein
MKIYFRGSIPHPDDYIIKTFRDEVFGNNIIFNINDITENIEFSYNIGLDDEYKENKVLNIFMENNKVVIEFKELGLKLDLESKKKLISLIIFNLESTLSNNFSILVDDGNGKSHINFHQLKPYYQKLKMEYKLKKEGD